MEFLNFDIENNNEKTTAKVISEHICDEIDEYISGNMNRYFSGGRRTESINGLLIDSSLPFGILTVRKNPNSIRQ